MLRLGLFLMGGAIVATGAGLAMLSLAASGGASSLGALVSCAPTAPPEEDEQESEQKSETTT